MNHLRPTPTDKKRNASAFREDIAAIKQKILRHYSKLFETDFQNYTENFLDGIYSDIFFDRNKIFEKLPDLSNVDADLFSKIVALAEEVKSLHKAVEYFQSKQGQALQIEKPFSSLSDIKKLNVSLTDAELNGKVKQDLQIISERIFRLQAQIKTLTLNCNESEFNAAIKSCDERTDRNSELSRYLKKYLTLLYYPIAGSFNHEIILVSLFGKADWSKAGTYLKFVVERHEKFFLNIYNELKAFYPHTDALLDIGTNIFRDFARQDDRFIAVDELARFNRLNTLDIFKARQLCSIADDVNHLADCVAKFGAIDMLVARVSRVIAAGKINSGNAKSRSELDDEFEVVDFFRQLILAMGKAEFFSSKPADFLVTSKQEPRLDFGNTVDFDESKYAATLVAANALGTHQNIFISRDANVFDGFFVNRIKVSN